MDTQPGLLQLEGEREERGDDIRLEAQSGLLQLAGECEERRGEIREAWQEAMAKDIEFSDLTAGPDTLLDSLIDTLRKPQDLMAGPDTQWNEAVSDIATSASTIGVISCQIRSLVTVVEALIIPRLDEIQRTEAILRLHRAAFLGLQVAARTIASEISRTAVYSRVAGLRNDLGYLKDINQISGGATLAYIDMDGLKLINDERGHEAGNQEIARLAAALSAQTGLEDTAYHFHGDEFGYIARNQDAHYVEDVLARVRAAGCPGFSYGVAAWPDEAEDWKAVRELADQRMRDNKTERKASGDAPARPK